MKINYVNRVIWHGECGVSTTVCMRVYGGNLSTFVAHIDFMFDNKNFWNEN